MLTCFRWVIAGSVLSLSSVVAQAQTVDAVRFTAARDSVLSAVQQLRALTDQRTKEIDIRTPHIGYTRRIAKGTGGNVQWRHVVRHLPSGVVSEKYTLRLDGKKVLHERRINGQLAWVEARRYQPINIISKEEKGPLVYYAKLTREGYLRVGHARTLPAGTAISYMSYATYAKPLEKATL